MTNSKNVLLNKHVDTLKKYIESGGPELTDFKSFDDFVKQIYIAHKKGIYSNSDLKIINSYFPNDFFEETMQGRAYRKNRGYAGDYIVIDKIMNRDVTTQKKYRNWDYYFHSQAAPQGVRNRKDYFLSKSLKMATEAEKLSILNIASGPCRDIHELYKNRESKNIETYCLDHDSEAIEFSRNLLEDKPVVFHNCNPFKFITDTRFDLIWSGGVFDYFDDRMFVRVLKKYYNFLNNNGKIIIGNFNKGNPSKNYMEIFGEWFLQYRNKEDLYRLALEAGICEENIKVECEPLGVNLFLIVEKN